MARLDPTYASLKKQMAANPDLPAEELEALKKKITAREKLLLPVYFQISLQFADLHDRAGRMKAKGVIRDILEWKNARRFFYWRVRRRLNEEYILRRMSATVLSKSTQPDAAHATDERSHHLHLLESWSAIVNFSKDDRAVAEWYEQNRKAISAKVDDLKAANLASELGSVIRDNEKAAWEGIRDVLRFMPVEERQKMLKFLEK